MVVWHPAERSCRSGPGASLAVYLPQVYPTGVGTMPCSATAAAEKPQRSCHKVATFDVLLQGLLELREHFQVHLVGFVQGLSGRELQQGTRLQALLEPLLYCSRWMRPLGAPATCSAPVLPWACRTSLPPKWSTIHLAKHMALIFLILKKVDGQGPTHLFYRGSCNILRRAKKIVLYFRMLTASMKPVCDL